MLTASVGLSWQMGQTLSSQLFACKDTMASAPHCQPPVYRASLPTGLWKAPTQSGEDGPAGRRQCWSSPERAPSASGSVEPSVGRTLRGSRSSLDVVPYPLLSLSLWNLWSLFVFHIIALEEAGDSNQFYFPLLSFL